MSEAVAPWPEQGNAKARLADAACQTEIIPMSAPLPLPLQYPANLVFAQSMLTICLGQLHHVDLCAMQLKMHLKEQALQSAAAAVAAAPPVATAAAAATVVQLDPAVEAAAAAAAATPEAAPAAAAQGAGAARQPEAQELERLQLCGDVFQPQSRLPWFWYCLRSATVGISSTFSWSFSTSVAYLIQSSGASNDKAHR